MLASHLPQLCSRTRPPLLQVRMLVMMVVVLVVVLVVMMIMVMMKMVFWRLTYLNCTRERDHPCCR